MSDGAGWDADVARLRTRARGSVLVRGDDGYDESRRVFNAMIDRFPALIVRCDGVDDVVAAVGLARTHGVPVSVKGGGHAVSGSAVCDGGVMLDLGRMKRIVIDPERRTAVAGPGLTLGEYDAASAAHGLATPFGVVSVTGIAGLTLGGGLGWLNGRYGLACDNLLAVDVVTADGTLVTADATEHEDLYWAVRGGGGRCGVVVSFTFRLHPVTTVLAGGLTYPADRAREALHHYHGFATSSPDAMSTAASVWRGPAGDPVVSVGVCWCGPVAEGAAVLRPWRESGPAPDVDAIGEMPYVALQKASDAGYPTGRQHYWKAGFLRQLPAEAIDVLVASVARAPSPYTGVGLQQMTGVAGRVPPGATAFAHRAEQYDCLILSQWDDPADSEANIAWTRALFTDLSPFLESGVYLNNLGDEEGDRLGDAFGDNYDRLTQVSRRYDPDHLFRSGPGLRPAHA